MHSLFDVNGKYQQRKEVIKQLNIKPNQNVHGYYGHLW